MKLLLAGVNGFIGKHLIPRLLEKGHEVICLVRNSESFTNNNHKGRITVITADLLRPETITGIPEDIDAAYYLIQDSPAHNDFQKLQLYSASNFIKALAGTYCQQIICMGNTGATNITPLYGQIADILRQGNIPLTVLRPSLIIGKGSPVFNQFRYFIEKRTILLVSGWIYNRCQPIALADVITYLIAVALNPACYGKQFDICGPDTLTLKALAQAYAGKMQLDRYIINIAFGILTSIPTGLQKELMLNNDCIAGIIPHRCKTFNDALDDFIKQNS